MGLPTPALKYILSCSKKYHFKGPLLTFGNQDIYANANTLNKWAKDYNLKTLNSKDILPSTSLDLKKINSQSSSFVHAKTFFKLLGISENNYYDIDKFDFDKPRILYDLQKPLSSKYKNFFNLIIDNGTIEHIFDIKSVMTNIVNISHIGAYVLQMVPTNNFINHGFYQINPTLFYDFYTANGFEIVESYIVETRPTGYRFHYYNQKSFKTFFVNPYSRLGTVFLVKKIKNIKTITSPTQFAYQHKKNTKIIFDKPTDKLRNIVPFKYHSFFYIFWVIYKQVFSKKKYFDIPFE